MTTQDLGRVLGAGEDDSSELGTLFARSPARTVQTSAAAGTGFVLSLLAALAVPFALMLALSLGLASIALVASVIGMARASRPTLTGGLLASVGVVLSLLTLALVGLRYVGVDTAIGADVAPTLRDWLDRLNALLPLP